MACELQSATILSHGATVKRVYKAGSHWRLDADNPNYAPQRKLVKKEHVLRVLPVITWVGKWAR